MYICICVIIYVYIYVRNPVPDVLNRFPKTIACIHSMCTSTNINMCLYICIHTNVHIYVCNHTNIHIDQQPRANCAAPISENHYLYK